MMYVTRAELKKKIGEFNKESSKILKDGDVVKYFDRHEKITVGGHDMGPVIVLDMNSLTFRMSCGNFRLDIPNYGGSVEMTNVVMAAIKVAEHDNV